MDKGNVIYGHGIESAPDLPGEIRDQLPEQLRSGRRLLEVQTDSQGTVVSWVESLGAPPNLISNDMIELTRKAAQRRRAAAKEE